MNNIFEKLKVDMEDEISDLPYYRYYRLGYNQTIEDIQAEYNKLCPKPSEFPDEYKWLSIDADGQTLFWVTKPESSCDCWSNITSKVFYPKDIEIPLGIDWRLCCWSIEDAKQIHGNT